MANKHEYIVVHHSITPRDLNADVTEASFNTTHKGKEYPKSRSGWYIGYHYVVFGDGEVRQYRQDNETGAHCRENLMNFKGLGICMVGNFDREQPSKAQALATLKLIKQLQERYKIPSTNITLHRDHALNSQGKPYKSCPGNNIPDDLIAYLASFDEARPSPWAERAWNKAKNRGIIKNSNPQDVFTAEQIAVILDRLELL